MHRLDSWINNHARPLAILLRVEDSQNSEEQVDYIEVEGDGSLKSRSEISVFSYET